MGTRVTLAYTNIFMGAFEETFISGDSEYHNNIIVYRRYIDDLFLIWRGDEGSALQFVNKLMATIGE